MLQKWIRTYPLHWFDLFLSLIARPFSKAETLQGYSQNGYFLMGAVLALFLGLAWSFGLVRGSLRQLPDSVRESIKYGLELIGLKDPPETLPLIVVLTALYWVVFFIKPVRLFIGEKFANVFFGVIGLAIGVGEWCLERRWISLIIVIVLAAFIGWAGVTLSVAVRQNYVLERDFAYWLDQVDTFFARSTVSRDESDAFKRVSAFWREDYEDVVALKDTHHPALLLHKMLDTLYLNEPPDKSWKDFLADSVPKLKDYAMKYQQRANEDMTDSEARAWALMNILMGRIYVRLSDGCDDCQELDEARKYFSTVNDKRYASAVHNGLGTVYAHAFTSMLRKPSNTLQSICQNPVQCAGDAIEQYSKISDLPCSFSDKRRRNNLIDLLARIGIHYDKLNSLGIRSHVSKLCKRDVRGATHLAQCIEDQVNELMPCAAVDPFIPLIFITAAQAYGTSAELKLKGGGDPASASVAAGTYLRLAYATNRNPKDIDFWGLCYFRFAIKDGVLDKTFSDAIKTGIPGLPHPNIDDLTEVIKRDAKECP